ncbi:hypothetical protein LCGC14_0794970 [marine sediment metagenome]|uniref:DNA methylase N-4/N-6 domain-containing protein n=1 Tax=marine sediment metagenome TaxID=412755 RepID=A0A0F9PRE5_9ZZZZ
MVINIPWGTVQYIDCMNKEKGLPSLPDKSIDLCITDIPFNVNIQISSRKKDSKHRSINLNKKAYDDNKTDYEDWCISWFKQLERICNGIVLQIGEKNIPMWCNIKIPKGYAFCLKRNARTLSPIAYKNMIATLIFYGKTNRMNNNFFDYYVNSGFLRKNARHKNLIHPCPLRYAFWEDLILRLKPKSVIDPFIGSGTTAEVCKKLNIPWIGYEINPIYKEDIESRLNSINLTKSGLRHWL